MRSPRHGSAKVERKGSEPIFPSGLPSARDLQDDQVTGAENHVEHPLTFAVSRAPAPDSASRLEKSSNRANDAAARLTPAHPVRPGMGDRAPQTL